VFEIRISPETPTEFKAVVRMLQELANARAESGQASGGAKTSSASVAAAPASTAEDAADAEGNASIDAPSPPSGEPDSAYSAQQVLEALQGYARENGAAALKEVLDRFGARRVSDIKPREYPEVMRIARGELAR
jgi:hypothetical protein